MANGIMTGSGTVSDPYLVADVYDFCSMNSGYYKLISDIDFNDHNTYKYGVTSKIIGGSGNAIYLDGDGHEVRNIVFSNDGTKLSFNTGSVSNTNFANIIINSITNGNLQIGASGGFTNCNFGYYLIDSTFKTIFGDSSNYITKFTNCTFNIAGKMCSNGNSFCSYFNMCHINFNKFNMNANTSAMFKSQKSGCGFNNSYITGLIESSNMNYCFNNGNAIDVKNSYIAVDNKSICWVLITSQSTILSCFIDKTLMPNIINPPSGVYLLTSEQFKDNDYLNSIGFLAIPIE